MTPEAIREVVLNALASVAPESASVAIDPRTSLRDQLDLDSVDFFRFIVGLHERLAVDIPERDYRELTTLESATAYLGAAVDRQSASTRAGG